MKILTLGCSNSCRDVLKQHTWAELLQDSFPQHQVRTTGSAGAGNEFNLLKLMHILERGSYDLILFQLTEPARLTLGTCAQSTSFNDYSNVQVGSSTLYTFNAHANDANLHRLLHEDVKADEFMLSHAVPSHYNLTEKVATTMLAAEQAALTARARLVFWSWFVPMEQLVADSGFSYLLRPLTLIPSNAETVLRPFQQWRAKDGHWYTPAHQKLLDSWLLPELLNHGIDL